MAHLRKAISCSSSRSHFGQLRPYLPIQNVTLPEYKAIEKELRLQHVNFSDPERPAELPCGLRKQ